MADITMCMNDLCPLGETCHRRTAIPSYLQSMAMFEPKYISGITACDMYWDNSKRTSTSDSPGGSSEHT